MASVSLCPHDIRSRVASKIAVHGCIARQLPSELEVNGRPRARLPLSPSRVHQLTELSVFVSSLRFAC